MSVSLCAAASWTCSLNCDRKIETSQIVPVQSPFSYFKLITILLDVSIKTLTLQLFSHFGPYFYQTWGKHPSLVRATAAWPAKTSLRLKSKQAAVGRFSTECCKAKPKPISNQLDYSANLIFNEFENVQQSSECSENIWKRLFGRRTTFEEFSETFGKSWKTLLLAQREIANLREITGYVKLRKVDLTALRSVDKHT